MRGISPTRGFGLLEAWLARARAKRANSLIPEAARCGTIIDIGCGVPATFLATTRFGRKIGIDIRTAHESDSVESIERIVFDVTKGLLPLMDESADVVTMLAMIEHVPRESIPTLLADIRRILRPKGLLVITSPTPFARAPLWILSMLGLISREEIRDHKGLLHAQDLTSMLESAGMSTLGQGTFEWGMNTWLLASR